MRPLTRVTRLALAAFFLLSCEQEKSSGPPPDRIAYYVVVDNAIKDIQKGNIEAALEDLGQVEKRRPDIGAARLLAQYVRLRQSAGEDLDRFPWDEGRKCLESILNIGSASDTVITYAKDELHWVGTHAPLFRRRADLHAKREKDDSLETKLEVYRELCKFPANSLAGRKAQAEAAKLRTEIAKHYLDRAKQALDQQKWADAIRRLEEAGAYVDDRSEIVGQIIFCEQAARDDRTLELARQAIDHGRFEEAGRLLATVREGSFYFEEATRLLEQLGADTPPPDEGAPDDFPPIDRAAAEAYNLGMSHLLEGRRAEARHHLERARELARPGGEVHRRILQALDQLPDR